MTPGKRSKSPAPRVALCVPTFRRPAGLRTLLSHVARLEYPGPLRIIVVDNDAEKHAGAALVAEISDSYRFPIVCVVEPRSGQTYAYNRAFTHACRAVPAADYIAVLDDDEYPAPDWLGELVRVGATYDADIAGGPVFPVFENPGHWLAQTGAYAPTRSATGPVPMIYGAGNMLIRRGILEQYLDEPFRHAFAYTGGSDEEFFWRCRRDGRRFAWADAAHVFETMPRARTTLSYLLRRKFRIGTGATRIERGFGRSFAGILRGWGKGLGLIGAGVLGLPFSALLGRRATANSLMRAARGAGRIAGEFGILYEEYR